jgi:hypothetical protein
MKCIRFSLFLALLLVTTRHLSAQASFVAKASLKVVGEQDVLEIDFTLDGVSEVDQFAPPSFAPFEVIQGPAYTSGFNLINGNASKYYSVTYYLKPPGRGKFTIGPATVMVNNQAVKSNSVSVEVVKGSLGSAAPATSNPFQGMMGQMNMSPFAPAEREGYGDQFLRKGEKPEEKIRRNMILKMTASKNTCYVGEPIIATCKLYSRLPSESKVAERPSFSGFSVFDMVQPEQGTISREVLGGRPYNGYLIRKAQLYPLQSGDLTIEPVELDNNVTLFRESKTTRAQSAPAGSVFDQMMKDFWGDEEGEGVPEKHQLNLMTPPLIIHVKPLPETGKPVDFSGAVGQFTLSSSLTNTNLKTNQTDTLLLVLTGSGNLPLVNAPALRLPSGLEAFDPSAKEDIDQTVSPIKGRKVFAYAFSANKGGQYTLPSISISYFDPQTATYKTDSTQPLLLSVQPGPSDKPLSDVAAPGERAAPAWWWWASGLLLALIAAAWIWKWRRGSAMAAARPQAPPPGLAPLISSAPAPSPESAFMAPSLSAVSADNAPVRRGEPRDTKVPHIAPVSVTTFESKDWMEGAREQLKGDNSAAYYRELNAGLWGLLKEHLDLGHKRDKALVLARLERKGFSPFVREEVRSLLEECELALYAPVHTGQDMQRTMEIALRLQKRLEHGLKD